MTGLYTLLLGEIGRRARPCAMFGAETDRAASRRGRRLIRSGGLDFASSSLSQPTWRLRRATRSEAIILLSFLARFAGADTRLFSDTELDGLLAARERVMLGFHVKLWMDPDSLRLAAQGAPDPFFTDPPPSAATDGGGQERPDPEREDEDASSFDEAIEENETLRKLRASLPENDHDEPDIPI